MLVDKVIMSRTQPEKTKEPHPLLQCVSPFLQLILFALIKMFTFGQLKSIMENDFSTFLRNLLTIPYSIRNRIDPNTFSTTEKIQQFVQSQATRHVNHCMKLVIHFFVKTSRFSWPTLLYILIVIFFLKCFTLHVNYYRNHRRPILLETKTKL